MLHEDGTTLDSRRVGWNASVIWLVVWLWAVGQPDALPHHSSKPPSPREVSYAIRSSVRWSFWCHLNGELPILYNVFVCFNTSTA